MTAAAGAVLGLDVHLVMSGDRPPRPEGNQLLDALFGAQLHFVGCPSTHWGELEIAREELTDQLRSDGLRPTPSRWAAPPRPGPSATSPVTSSWFGQCVAAGVRPAAIVHATASGGTHTGLVAGRALLRAPGEPAPPWWRSGSPGV